MPMTSKQMNYINSLARQHGYQSAYYAISAATGESISRLQRKGVTAAQASKTIDFLLAKDGDQ